MLSFFFKPEEEDRITREKIFALSLHILFFFGGCGIWAADIVERRLWSAVLPFLRALFASCLSREYLIVLTVFALFDCRIVTNSETVQGSIARDR